jgi:hypothetical protein
MSDNSNLHVASKDRNDEFYTRREDIEDEVERYAGQLAGKAVYCNCDDPATSEFYRYFAENFDRLGLKKVICTHKGENPIRQDLYRWGMTWTTPLKGDGSFDSPECLEALAEADVVVTNPPFSLFRKFVDVLAKSGKRFLVIGYMTAIGYKEIFPLIRDGRMWLGVCHGQMEFRVPDGYVPEKGNFRTDEDGHGWCSFGNTCWYTNMENDARDRPLGLTEAYEEGKYPRYGNRDAIDVSRVKAIPCDYMGEMGVPLTFMFSYCPEQFEITGFRKGDDGKDLYVVEDGRKKELFTRILIRRRSA